MMAATVQAILWCAEKLHSFNCAKLEVL